MSGPSGARRAPVPPAPSHSSPQQSNRDPVWASPSSAVPVRRDELRLGRALAAAGRLVAGQWRRLASLTAVTCAPGLVLAMVAWRRLPDGDINWLSQALRAPAEARQALWFTVVALLLGRMVLVAGCTWTFQASREGRTLPLDRVLAAGMRGDVVRQVAPGPLAILFAFGVRQLMLQPDRGIGVVLLALVGAPGLLLALPLLPLAAGLWWLRTIVWLERDGQGRQPGTDAQPRLQVRDLMRGHTSVVWGWCSVFGVLAWTAIALVVGPIAGSWPVGPLGWVLVLAVANATVPWRVAATVQLRERVVGSGAVRPDPGAPRGGAA